jgi:xylulokinase
MAGGNLRFIAEKLIKGRDEMIEQEHAQDIFQAFNSMCARVPAGARGIVFLPWTFGERSPIEDHTVRGGLINLSLNHSQEDIIRAVFEGVAFNSRWLFQGVERFMGRQARAVRFSGGGARSEIWAQIYADILDRAILQMDEPIMTNSRGAAFIGAVGIGELKFADIPAMVKIKRVFEPNSRNLEVYDERFAIFQKLYHQNKKLYRRLNGNAHAQV